MSAAHPDRTPAMTVAEALRLPALRRGRPQVLAGREHLDRPVRWVHVAEVAEIAQLLRGGELLLTTGQALDTPPRGQREFVQQLADREVAGVVLELGRHLSAPPEPALAEARRRGLPFVVLRRETRFVDITEELHHRLIDARLSVLERVQVLDRTLTGLVAGGEGISAVVEALARAVGARVSLRGSCDEVLHATEPSAPGREDEWLSIKVPGETVAHLGLRGPHGQPGAYETLAAERAADLIGVLMGRANQQRLLVLRQRAAFLTELARGTVVAEDAERRAARLGLRSGAERLLPVVALLGRGEVGELAERTDVLAQFARDLQVEAESKGRGMIGVDPRRLIGLVTVPRGCTREMAADRLAASMHGAATRRFGADAEMVVVIGEEAGSIGTAAGPLLATLEASGAAADVAPRPWHDAAAPDLDRLLIALRADRRVARFVDQRMRPVLQHDAGSATPLLPTLVALIDNLGHRSKTSRALGIRRQTLYRRVERLERLLGGSLDDADTLLALHLAVHARRVLA